MRAICTTGQLSDPTDQACVTTENYVCEAPTNVTAQAINYTDIFINWAAVPNAETYKIYRNGTLITWGYPSVGGYYDTELPYGEYCYTIVAECATGDSDPSEEACATLSIPCNAPQNFKAEYVYEDEENYGVKLQWVSTAPIMPAFFNLYRANDDGEYELIENVTPDGLPEYYCFDNAGIGSYAYMLTAEYQFDGQVCVSEPVYASVEVTHVNEMGCSVSIYPNPTKGEVKLEGNGLRHVRIVNAYGQTVYSADHEGDHARIDLSGMAKGVYLMHIEAESGRVVKKVVVE